jgi:hypothetical protein
VWRYIVSSRIFQVAHCTATSVFDQWPLFRNLLAPACLLMLVDHDHVLSIWFDHMASFVTIRSLLSINRHLPTNFSLWGVERFVLDDAADEVAFKPPPPPHASQASWLVNQMIFNASFNGVCSPGWGSPWMWSWWNRQCLITSIRGKGRKGKAIKEGMGDVPRMTQGKKKQERKRLTKCFRQIRQSLW